MLNHDDLNILKAPFAAADHEFLRGKCYIREWAICDRIEEVDPAWTFERLSLDTRTGDGTKEKTIVIATFRLTIKGVSRDGVGMSDVLLRDDKSDEANEPEKAAATDALKRAARLFGIGRYLLRLPVHVKDERSLEAHLTGKTVNMQQARQNLTGAGQERRIPPINGSSALKPELEPEKQTQAGTAEATRVKYVTEGKSKYVVFNTPQAPRLYGRDLLRELGPEWETFAASLDDKPNEPVDLPHVLIVTQTPHKNYWLVEGLRLAVLS